MGIFKKLYAICFVFLLATTTVHANETTSVAVIPVSIKVQGSNDMAYPRTCGLISADIANTLNAQSNFKAAPISINEKIIVQHNLAKKYNLFLTTYKTRYIIDYDILKEIADILEVEKVLLVQGGFDVQQVFLNRPLTYKLSVPTSSPVIPLYKYNLAINLIDPYKQTLVMRKNYTKNFKVREFGIASDDFAENVVPVAEIRKFSNTVSNKVVQNINYELNGIESGVISKKTNAILTKIKVKNTNSGLATDGTVTTDGHPISPIGSKIKTKRQENYEDWALDNL